MNTILREVKDAKGKIAVVIISVQASPFNPQQMAAARVQLNHAIDNCVGHRGHNIYIHSKPDTVSATIVFDINDLDYTEKNYN